MITALLLSVQTSVASPTSVRDESDSHAVSHSHSLRSWSGMWSQGDYVPRALVSRDNWLDGLVCACSERDRHVGMTYTGVNDSDQRFVWGECCWVRGWQVDDAWVVALTSATR